MASISENESEDLQHVTEVIDTLAKELLELYEFRNLFFENHPIEKALEKNKLVEEKKNALIEKFEKIDADTEIPSKFRAQFLYMKGRCYNITPVYDNRAIQCLSKAVKLNPRLTDAWNELGEAYWKNMNLNAAKASFEGALKHEKNRVSLRSLSIILRQQSDNKSIDIKSSILKSVELAKEAVSNDIKDGVSWTVLGNAYLCQFFLISQDPAVLKLCMSAYRQAYQDPIARGQPDLYYNKAIALKYAELYDEALDSFEYATRLDPPWEPPRDELSKLTHYLSTAHDLVRTKGKIKTKKLMQMVQSTDKKMLGPLGMDPKNPADGLSPLALTTLDSLKEGVDVNKGTVILGRVVGSIRNDCAVPFTFAIVDESLSCVLVTVYNWAKGSGVIIGDCVAIPEPTIKEHRRERPPMEYSFKSIRVNNPLSLVVNGKRVSHNQFATAKVISTYETL